MKRRIWPVWVTVAVLFVTAGIHILMGTPEASTTVSDLAPEAAALWMAVWHVTSVLLVSLPVALIWAARAKRAAGRPVVSYVWFLNVVFVVVFVVIDVMEFGSAVFTLPQWVLFVPGAVLLPFARWAAPTSRSAET